jgi:hypothetical protein
LFDVYACSLAEAAFIGSFGGNTTLSGARPTGLGASPRYFQ